MTASPPLLAPRDLVALHDLELAARTLAAGVMHGIHHSRAIGAGLEFSQFRSYQPGDDLRRVDWKLYARSDRFYVREAEVESSVTIRLVLDASRSMAHAEDGVGKARYAAVLLAACAWLARQQGDAIALYRVTDRGVDALPPARHPPQFQRVFHALAQAEPAGAWPDWSALEGYLTRSGHQRELVVVATDLHEREHEIRTALARLAGLGHEVLVCQVLGRHELQLDWPGDVTLEELETGQRLELAAGDDRAAARAALAAHLAAVQRDLEGRGIALERCRLDELPVHALHRFLARRHRAR